MQFVWREMTFKLSGILARPHFVRSVTEESLGGFAFLTLCFVELCLPTWREADFLTDHLSRLLKFLAMLGVKIISPLSLKAFFCSFHYPHPILISGIPDFLPQFSLNPAKTGLVSRTALVVCWENWLHFYRCPLLCFMHWDHGLRKGSVLLHTILV